MRNADKIILVSGATGRQGGATIDHLLEKGWRVRGLTRNIQSRPAVELARRGVEVVQGDLEDTASLQRAAKGVHGIYSVQDFWSIGAKREVLQGKNLADAALAAGIAHFVYSSVGGAERSSGIAHWESKWEIENYIRSRKLPATILRPVGFMENYYFAGVEIGLLNGKLADPIRGDKTYQSIAVENVGAFAALAFERPKEFIGAELEIAGPR